MTDDKELQDRLDGLFSDVAPQPEEAPDEAAQDDERLEPGVAAEPEEERAAARSELTADAVPDLAPVLDVSEMPEDTIEQAAIDEILGATYEDQAALEDVEADVVAEPPESMPEDQPAAAPPSPQEAEAGTAPSGVSLWRAAIEEQRRKIVDVMLVVATVVGGLFAVGPLVAEVIQDPGLWGKHLPYFIAYLALVVVTFGRRLDITLRTGVLLVLAYGLGTLILMRNGLTGTGALYLLIAPLLVSILVGQRRGFASTAASAGLSAIIYAAVLFAMHRGWFEALGIEVQDVDVRKWSSTLNAIGTFAMLVFSATLIQQVFNATLARTLREAEDRNEEIIRSRVMLEHRAQELADLNAVLQKRSRQLETAGQVSQVASMVLDPDELMRRVAGLIHQRFHLYHVSVFLTEEPGATDDGGGGGQEAAIRAATGVAGEWMLAQDERVEVGDASVVGQCMATGQAQSVGKGAHDEWPEGDFLPESRCELALPLRSRGRVFGALDVHTTSEDGFADEDIAVLQTLADQVAVAIDNAQLFRELQQRLQEMEAAQRLYVREQWEHVASRERFPLYQRSRPDVGPISEAALSEALETAWQRKMIVRSGDDEQTGEATVVAPISLRGVIIGALGLEKAENRQRWSDEEIALIEAVVDQMALAIENARLLEETRQLATWGQQLSDITAHFTRSLDTEALLKTAIRELGQLLQMDEVAVHIGAPDDVMSVAGEENQA